MVIENKVAGYISRPFEIRLGYAETYLNKQVYIGTP